MNVRAIALMAGLTSVLPGTGLVLGAEWVQAAKVASDQPYQQEFFGNTVAVSGSFAAVGTLNYNSGCGYIFECDSGVWGIAEKLDNGQIPTRQFGCSVAISENLALFGASGEPGGGAAYLYRREASGWTQEARLVPTGMQSGNYFGYSVAVSGEFAVVGAPGAIYGDSLAGEAFLFHRGSQGWSQVAKLSVAGTTHLGVRVSLTDGYALLGSCSEAAYVFQYDQFQVTGPVPLSGTDTIPGDHFGRDACTIDGNYAVVGAALDDDRGENAGAAYVFQRQGNDWREVQRLEALDSAANSYFGTSASLRGDVLVIGADYTSPGSAFAAP